MIALGPWVRTSVADRHVRALADRHYPRLANPVLLGGRTVGPPGERLVFITEDKRAAWITSRQRPETVKHAWPGAWVNSFFRNEGPERSSDLIRAAVDLSEQLWGAQPEIGLITFIDAATSSARFRPREATSARRSRRAPPGVCYRFAGWHELGVTKGGHGRPSLAVFGTVAP